MKKGTLLLTLYSILLFTACTDPKIEGKYYSEDEYSYIEFAELNSDSLFARHCFVMSSGNRIDCCPEEVSIRLVKSVNHTYTGKMHSCYDDASYDLKLTCTSGECHLKIENSYPFVKSWVFRSDSSSE